MGAEIKATRLGDRYVTVKGLVERKVKSDLAIWPISYKEAGDDLASLYAKTEADKKTVLQFLSEQGIQSSEIELGVVRVVDTQANEYGGVNRAPHRYIVEQQIAVRTGRVEQVAAAAQKTMQLLRKGIVLSGKPGAGTDVQVHWVERNQTGHDHRSHQKRESSGGSLCLGLRPQGRAIRQANQGVFSILPADQGDASESGEMGAGSFAADSSLMKTVRVVTTVQYYLEK